MRSRVTCMAVVAVLGLCLTACGDGRQAELQIVVHARSVPVFGGRVQGILYPAVAVRWSIDLVEIGGRPCRLTGLVIGIHNPDHGDSTRAYTAANLLVAPEIPAYGRLHLDHGGWLSIEDYVNTGAHPSRRRRIDRRHAHRRRAGPRVGCFASYPPRGG